VRDLPSYDIRVERAILDPRGVDVISVDMDDPEAFGRLAPAADAVLNMRGRLDATRIGMLARCRIIAHYGTGIDRVDVGEATRRGIWLTNGPRYAVDEVSSHAIALLLAAARKIVPGDRAVRAGQWHIKPIVPLHRIAGRTLGLLGFGNIARAAGRKGRAFALHVIACDPFVDPAVFSHEQVERVGLDECLSRADFLSIHLPLTPQTRNLINRATLALMKRGAILVNTSRGGVIDEPALIEALESGHLGAAGLDVFAFEPLPTDHRLLQLPSVTVSGHVAFYSEESIQQMQRDAALQVVQALEGTVPEFLVNREVLSAARPSTS
jgi:D-3-phosphoglycerate dehydrogenase